MADEVSKPLSKSGLIELTSRVVAAYVSCNAVAVDDIPDLIALVHDALAELAGGSNFANGTPAPTPAVSIALSVEDEYIICLEDGLRFKSLKRHLRARYEMTPEAYREKWGLPANYPMVAPGYSRRRSALAVQSGLGRNDKV